MRELKKMVEREKKGKAGLNLANLGIYNFFLLSNFPHHVTFSCGTHWLIFFFFFIYIL